MPYRLNPKDKTEVQVKKSGKWRRYKKYSGRFAKSKALALLRALSMNVRHK